MASDMAMANYNGHNVQSSPVVNRPHIKRLFSAGSGQGARSSKRSAAELRSLPPPSRRRLGYLKSFRVFVVQDDDRLTGRPRRRRMLERETPRDERTGLVKTQDRK